MWFIERLADQCARIFVVCVFFGTHARTLETHCKVSIGEQSRFVQHSRWLNIQSQQRGSNKIYLSGMSVHPCFRCPTFLLQKQWRSMFLVEGYKLLHCLITKQQLDVVGVDIFGRRARASVRRQQQPTCKATIRVRG